MHTKFYFTIQYFNFDLKITITVLRSHRNKQCDKSDSNQCYSESESATAYYSHSTGVST